MKKFIVCLFCIVILCSLSLSFFGCDEAESAPLVQTEPTTEPTVDPPRFGIRNDTDPIVAFTFSTGDVIRVELYEDIAPITVENFLKYVEDGFYEGVAFHRIIKNFMIQTGGFTLEDGRLVQKNATYPTIKGEFASNGVQNPIKHTEGVISMARSNSPDSASSQFFLCSATSTHLDGNYAAFGCVIDEESMEVIKRFETVSTSQKYLFYGETAYPSADVPDVAIVITQVTRVR